MALLLATHDCVHNYNSNFIQQGWTPLLAACAEGYADIVKELLQHQIQLEIENNVSQQENYMCITCCYL